MVLKHIIVAFTLLFTASIVYPSDVKFFNINNLHDISIRETNSVVKDSTGFVWVSSKNGVLRITDEDCRVYQIPYETANIISVKLIYEHSLLLAYTNNGQIFLYNPIKDRFELKVNISKELNNEYYGINNVVVDNEGSFWMSSSFGLMKYQNNEIISDQFATSAIHQIVRFDESQIIVSSSSGIFLLDTKTTKRNYIYRNNNPYTFETSRFYLDKETMRLWIGTVSNGLFYFDFKENKISKANIESLPLQPILAIESISNTSLMLGIDGQGLWEISKDGKKVLNVYKENADNPSSLFGNGVYDILCDRNKRVWVCTFSGGISYFNLESPVVNQITHQINNSNSLANNEVNGIIEDSNKNLWFATNNGISVWDVYKNQWKNYYTNNKAQAQVFLTLCEDSKGRIWAGTYASGVYVIDANTGKQLAHYSKNNENSPFINEFVFDIYKDRNDDIWIGGINSEVIRYQHKTNTFRKYSVQPALVLCELSANEMLFGCSYGLTVSNNETGETRTLINNCLVNDILVLDNIIWVASGGDGLIRFDLSKLTLQKFTTNNGLPSNFVNSITYSDFNLWLGTENGLCKFDPIENSVTIYSNIISLSKSSFNKNAHANLKNGNLAWGTNNGVVIFNPRTIAQPHEGGKIFFQDLSISGRSVRDIQNSKITVPVDNIETVKLKHNQNTFTLELIPIEVPSGSKFSWKLDGINEEWTQPSDLRIISYNNIPSKDYTLNIKLYDNSMSQLLAERSIKIIITPPFWSTWWFLVLVFVAVTSLIYFGFWYYINQLKQQHTEEKIRFFTNTAHDMRTSLTLIKAPVEELSLETNLSSKGKHYLQIANEQVKRLSSVVTQLMDFQKVDIGKAQVSLSNTDIVQFVKYRADMYESFCTSRGISLSFESNSTGYQSAIDEFLMEKVIDNLISNAVKYSFPQGSVKLELTCYESKWELTVSDNGIGISKKAQRQLFKEFYRGENAINSKIVGSGIGLLLAKNYVELHGGQISFLSQENVGSTFKISIPFKEALVTKNKAFSGDIQENNKSKNIQANIVASSDVAYKDISVLIVEDNEDLLQFISMSLGDDFEILTSTDGVQAWEIIKEKIPDMIVSDVMMPNMDGFELCLKTKNTFETSHIPMVLLTSLSANAEQIKGLEYGADDYITKPFDMTLLKQKIKTIVKNREIVREKILMNDKNNNGELVLTNNINNNFLKKMIEVVQENISNTNFGKEEFASAMNVSTSLLYKKIKTLTNQSPTDLIKEIRLNHALSLLKTKNYTVTEVSEMCGFSSVGYFSTVFKKHYGKPPTEAIT